MAPHPCEAATRVRIHTGPHWLYDEMKYKELHLCESSSSQGSLADGSSVEIIQSVDESGNAGWYFLSRTFLTKADIDMGEVIDGEEVGDIVSETLVLICYCSFCGEALGGT